MTTLNCEHYYPSSSSIPSNNTTTTTTVPCEVCATTPPHAPHLSQLLAPLLTCRSIYEEAREVFYGNLTVVVTEVKALRWLMGVRGRELGRRVRGVDVWWHLVRDAVGVDDQGGDGDGQGTMRREREVVREFVGVVFGGGDGKKGKVMGRGDGWALQEVNVRLHLDAPGSYDLLTPAIHLMAPFASIPATNIAPPLPDTDINTNTTPTTPLTTTTSTSPHPSPNLTLLFAYRHSYTMFDSPLLGAIATTDLLSEHSLVLRELLTDEQFQRGVAERDEEEQTWALLRVARAHERRWLAALARKRLARMQEGAEKERVRRGLAGILGEVGTTGTGQGGDGGGGDGDDAEGGEEGGSGDESD